MSVPLREGNAVLAEDFNDGALSALKIRGIGVRRLKIWNDDDERYHPAFSNGKAAAFQRVDGRNELRLDVEISGKEIALHAPLTEEEVHPELGNLKVFIKCIRYSKVRFERHRDRWLTLE